MVIPGLFVVGAYSNDNFRSGNLTMIRPQNRYFSKDEGRMETLNGGESLCTENYESRRLTNDEETKIYLSDSLVGELSHNSVAEESDNKSHWGINKDGEAHCPYCKTYAIDDEYNIP